MQIRNVKIINKKSLNAPLHYKTTFLFSHPAESINCRVICTFFEFICNIFFIFLFIFIIVLDFYSEMPEKVFATIREKVNRADEYDAERSSSRCRSLDMA